MSKILEAMQETARGLYDAGVMDVFTMRQIDDLCLSSLQELGPEEIKEIRLQNRVSQPVFAKYLNVQPVTVKKWESGTNSPSGSSLKLLHLIKRKGLEVLHF